MLPRQAPPPKHVLFRMDAHEEAQRRALGLPGAKPKVRRARRVLTEEEREHNAEEERQRKAVAMVFARCDLNKNGKIEKRELVLVLGNLGSASLPDDVVDQILTAADLNKDGDIDLDEFLRWVWYGGDLQNEIMNIDEEVSSTAASKLKDMEVQQERLDEELNRAAINFDTHLCCDLIDRGADPKKVFRRGVDAWYEGDSSTCVSNAITQFRGMDKTEQEARQEQFVELVVFLLAKGADTNFCAMRGNWSRVTHTPLIKSATETVQYLGTMDLKRKFLKAFVDLDVCLHRPIRRGKQKEEYGFGSTDYPIFQMLEELEEDGDVSLIALYLENGVDVECAQESWEWSDGEGTTRKRTPLLHAAIKTGNVELVRLLVANGANVNSIMFSSFDDERPTKHKKLKKGKAKKKIVKKARDAEEHDAENETETEDHGKSSKSHWTCLQLAIERENSDMIEILRRAGAEAEITSEPDERLRNCW